MKEGVTKNMQKAFLKTGDHSRTNNLLHNLTNKIVSTGKVPIMENLTHIASKEGRKGNGKGKKFRFRLHMWPRFRIRYFVSYKSMGAGRMSVVVSPKGTSSRCSACGGAMIPEERRLVRCSACGLVIDRDRNAARNLYYRGVRFAPVARQEEAMKQFRKMWSGLPGVKPEPGRGVVGNLNGIIRQGLAEPTTIYSNLSKK